MVDFPRVDWRRRRELFAELLERARVILPEVQPAQPDREWLRGLLDIAARLETEVTRRLDRVPEKNRRNFFDWLGRRGRAARAARLVSVFRRAQPQPDQPLEPLLVPPRARLQAQTDDGSLVFEIQQDLRIFAGSITALVAVTGDRIFQPPPGLFDPAAPPPVSMVRQLKSFAAAGSDQIQITPALGLEAGNILAIGEWQYRLKELKGDLVTIEPPLLADAAADAAVAQVIQFAPFGSASAAPIAAPHDWQEHILYVGDDDLLNIEAPATITVESNPVLMDANWSYWGKIDKEDGNKPSDVPAWQELTAAADISGVKLTKPYKGAIEKFEVNGQKIRVLRAMRSSSTALLLSAIKLKTQSPPQTAAPASGESTGGSAADGGASQSAAGCPQGVAFEGIANIAPIPSPQDFYPLGQAPRLFDAFYVGCAEAFSKQDARATLQFEMAGATLGPLAGSRNQDSTVSAFGVGTDGLLYQLVVTPSTATTAAPSVEWKVLARPSDALGAGGGAQATGGRVVSLATAQQPAVTPRGTKTSIAVHGGSEVWWLDEVPADPTKARWRSLGAVEKAAVTATVVLQDGLTPHAFAACGGKLYEQSVGSAPKPWHPDGAAGIPSGLQLIAPFSPVDSVFLPRDYADGILATNETGDDPNKQRRLYFRRGNSWTEVSSVGSNLVPNVLPLGVRLGAGKYLIVAAVQDGVTQKLVAVEDDNGTIHAHAPLDLGTRNVERALTFVPRGDGETPVIVFVASEDKAPGSLGLWRPGSWNEASYINGPVAGRSFSQGAAVVEWTTTGIAPRQVVVVGSDADVMTARLESDSFQLAHTSMRKCIVTTRLEPLTEFVEVDDGVEQKLYSADGPALDLGDGSAAYRLHAAANPSPDVARCRLFKSATPVMDGDGDDDDPLKLVLDTVNDTLSSARTDFIKIGNHVYAVDSISSDGVATLKAPAGAPAIPSNPQYRYLDLLPDDNDPAFIGASANPLLDVSALSAGVRSLLESKPLLIVPGASPGLQPVLFFHKVLSLAVLAHAWTAPLPTGLVQFSILPRSFDPWQWLPYHSPANPALSWEYWNGTGWWKLKLNDATDHLRSNGIAEFDVPPDIKPTDVLGRPNYWIRARLIGGDYGPESFSVESSGGIQTYKRNLDAVRAPHILCLTIRYVIKEGQFPSRIITRDNLAWRDQSATNRAPNAVLELYQPFREALAELKGSAAESPQAEGCCGESVSTATSASCSCQDAAPADDCPACNGAASDSPDAAPTAAANITNALFLGTDVQLEKSSVRILWDVVEQQQGTELVIEALHDGAFAKVLPEDETEGLAETGILTLSFDQSPGLSSLFGQSLYWLRVRPKKQAHNETWKPVISRVCLNAAWAEAAESQEMEILGSSDGAPNQKVSVARPPVLDKSLELRVREPLTEDEVAELRRTDPSIVRDDVPNVAGTWVRWTRVADPLDCAPGDRVYALDEMAGDISFGDALHGAVPPRGRDNIATFFYRRGGGATANGIRAGGALQLVSPLPGVEGVVAAVESAGGADSASIEETLRHAPALLWARDRAISTRDVERLALAYAPEIVQARCVAAPGRAASARLVVAVTGKDPRPGRATRHELERYLLGRAVPALDDGKRFRVDAPRTKSCRIEIRLTVDSLNRAGSIEQAATGAIHALLHWVTGGLDGRGWPIGAVPAEDDFAAVLVDIPGILGIGKVAMFDAASSGDAPFPSRVPDDTLVMLAPNGVKIDIAEEGA